MTDITPKELCDLGICVSRAQARRMMANMVAFPDHSSTRELRAFIDARARIAELQTERERRLKGMAQMCDFMHHRETCMSLNGDPHTCDCGMSLALMIAMNPHMDIDAERPTHVITPPKEDDDAPNNH